MSRQGLSDEAKHGLIMSSVAIGRWNSLGIERIDALDILQTYCKVVGSREDDSSIVQSLVNRTQDALMAFRKDDFYTIQKEPPFSDFAATNLLHLLAAWRDGGERGVSKLFDEIFPLSGSGNVPANQIIRLKGGNGFSEEEAILVGVRDLQKRVRCEYWYLNYALGDECDFGMHMTTFSEKLGRKFSVFVVTHPNGRSKNVYFDITDQTYD